MPVQQKIKETMSSLTPSERKVARVLLANYPIAGLHSINELSDASGVSGPTVVRFVSRLGYESYPAFQKSLLAELKDRIASPLELDKVRDTALEGPQLLGRSLDSFTASLNKTFSNIIPEDFDSAVQLISDPKRNVTFIGGRYSEILAQYMYRHVRQLRDGCAYISNADTFFYERLVDVDKRSVLVAFDFRRYQKETEIFAEKAVERGAKLVLITDLYLSPVASHASCVLPTDVSMETSLFDSYVPALAVSEVLIAAIARETGDAARLRMQEQEKLASVRGDN